MTRAVDFTSHLLPPEIKNIVWPAGDETTYSFKGKGKDRHRYYLHTTLGWERPGVTTILNPWDKAGLINWAANIEREATIEAATEVLQILPATETSAKIVRQRIEEHLGIARQHVKKKEAAANIGQGAHSMIQWRLKGMMGERRGKMPVIGVESTVAVMAWERYFEQSGIKPLRVEQPVWSDKYGYAGTIDLVGLRDGKVGVVDDKTSKALYPTNHMQLAAYAHAVEEMTGLKVEWCELWRLPKSLEDLSFECRKLEDTKRWNGEALEPHEVSREKLFKSFLGIKEAFDNLVAP